MRVLIVHPAFWLYGGAERVIVKLCNYLTEHNIDNTILTQQMIPEVKRELIETRIIEVGSLANMANMLDAIAQDFDVINIHNEPCQLLTTRRLNTIWSFNELPSIIQLGGELPEIEIQRVKNFINRIIVADETNKIKVKTVYGKEGIIVPYGIDYDFFQEGNADKFREQYNLAKEDFIISQVAFIAPTKNQLETVRIFAEVRKSKPNAKLILAGPILEDYKKIVEEEIFKLELYGEVYFTGKITREEVRDLLKASSLTIQPNRGQGSWLSVFEAISSEVPVYVSEEFTGSDLVKQLDNGFVCSDTEDFVKKILDYSKKTFEKDKKWVRENLNWDNYCKKMAEVFYESLSDKS
jgi:glycosyltransferase involved in cell wall biosynthesis